MRLGSCYRIVHSKVHYSSGSLSDVNVWDTRKVQHVSQTVVTGDLGPEDLASRAFGVNLRTDPAVEASGFGLAFSKAENLLRPPCAICGYHPQIEHFGSMSAF